MPTNEKIPSLCFPLIFEKIVEHYPHHTAIYWVTQNNEFDAISYYQLNCKANQLARFLKENCSADDDKIIAVCMERGPNYLISLLAIWKAGFIYQPLDYNSEANNISARIMQSSTAYLLVDSKTKNKIYPSSLGIPHSCIDDLSLELFDTENFTYNRELTDDAYLMASSGSTGIPKLIMNTFEGLPGRINGFLEQIDFEPNSCVLGFSGYGFDASLMDIIVAFSTHSAILIVPESARQDIQNELMELLLKAKAKNIHITYAALIPDVIRLIDPDKFLFRNLITMGAKANWSVIEKLIQKGSHVFDGYGPTETTIAASMRKLSLDHPNGIIFYDSEQKKTEGLLPDVILCLVEKQGEQYIVIDDYTVGEGEIVLGGQGVGYYWKNESLNKEKFIYLPQLSPGRFYLTGDIAKYNNGALQIIGRNNREIKLNGRKLNLDEFEEKLKKINDVQDAAVTLINNSMTAFITLNNIFSQDIHAELIRNFQLIFSGLSAYLFTVNEIPKTHSKRTPDYTNLSNPASTSIIRKWASSGEFEAYQTPLENKIAEICVNLFINAEVLQLSHTPITISRHQSIVELGADSLKLSVLYNLLWKELVTKKNQHIYPTAEFKSRFSNTCSIAELAKIVENFNYEPLCILKEGNLPCVFLVSSLDCDTEEKNLIKRLQANTHLTAQLCLLSLAPHADVDSLAHEAYRAILDHQPTGPYQVVFFPHQERLRSSLENQFSVDSTVLSWTLHSLEDINKLGIELSNAQDRFIQNALLQLMRHNLQQLLVHSNTTYSQFLININNISSEAIQYIQTFATQKITESVLFLMDPVGSNAKILVRQLIEFNLTCEAKDKTYIIYIDLSRIKIINYIQDYLHENGIFNYAMEKIKQQNILFIVDNYDLMDRYDYCNLWHTNHLNEWPHVKLVVISNLNINESLIKQSWSNCELSVAHLQSIGPTPFISQSELASPQEQLALLKNQFESILKKLRFDTKKYDFDEFLIYAKSFYTNFPTGADLDFSGSYWDPEYSEETIQKYQDVMESKYYMVLKYYLDISQENLGTLPPIFVELLKMHPLPSSQPLQNIPDATSKTNLLNFYKMEILSEDPNLLPIFAFCPLSGEIPESYRNIASTLSSTHTLIVFTLVLTEPVWQFSNCFNLDTVACFFAEQILLHYPGQNYHLLGWSFGGLTAFCVTEVLERLGHSVKLLLTIDSPAINTIDTLPLINRSSHVIQAMTTELYSAPGSKDLSLLVDEWSKSISDHSALFRHACNYLEQHQTTSDHRTLQLILKLNICYLNLTAQYQFAQNYKLLSKLHTLHYSAIADIASPFIGNGVDNIMKWNEFCENHHFQIFPGTHFTIFNNTLFNKLFDIFLSPQEINKLNNPSSSRIKNYLKNLIERVTQQYGLKQLPIPAQTTSANTENNKNIENALKYCFEFIESGNDVLAISGVAGSGKSTLMNMLSLILARSYLNFFGLSQVTNDSQLDLQFYTISYPFTSTAFFPIHIDSFNRSHTSIIDVLMDNGFSQKEAQDLGQLTQIVIILDEAENMNYKLETLLANFKCQTPPKIIICGRSLNETDPSQSVEDFLKQRPANIPFFSFEKASYVVKMQLQQLTAQLVDQYLNYHNQHGSLPFSNYAELIIKYPTLKDLVINPLSLALFLAPFLQKNTSFIHLAGQNITKSHLYAAYLEIYMSTQIEVLQEIKGIPAGYNFHDLFYQFTFELAQTIKNKTINHRKFLHPDPVTTTLCKISPIMIHNEKIKFFHETFQDFMIALRIFKNLIDGNEELFKIYKALDDVLVMDFLFDLLSQHMIENATHEASKKLLPLLTAIIIIRRKGADEVCKIFESTPHADLHSYDYAIALYEAGQGTKAKEILMKIVNQPYPKTESADIKKLFSLYCNMGTICHQDKDYPNAYLFFEKALEFHNSKNLNDPNIGYLYNAIANLYNDDNNLNTRFSVSESKKYYALSVDEKNRYPHIVKTKRFIGWAYFGVAKIAVYRDKDLQTAKEARNQFYECIIFQFGPIHLWATSYVNCLNDIDSAIMKLEHDVCYYTMLGHPSPENCSKIKDGQSVYFVRENNAYKIILLNKNNEVIEEIITDESNITLLDKLKNDDHFNSGTPKPLTNETQLEQLSQMVNRYSSTLCPSI